MAQTITLVSQFRQREQFNGLFSEMWKVRATIDDQDAVAATAIGEWDLSIDGIALGDIVLFSSINLDLDDGTDQALTVQAHVSAAGVMTVQVAADNAEFAADAINTAVFRAVIGRPNW